MELVREIIIPTDNSYLLRLPDNMIGKHVEVIAFELKKPALEDNETKDDRNQKIAEIREIFKDSLLDLSNFKFDRDEANNYDE